MHDYPQIRLLFFNIRTNYYKFNLNHLFGIKIDETLRSDVGLKEDSVRDKKKLAYPGWKTFFDCVFLLGMFLLVAKLIILCLNLFLDTNIVIPAGLPKILSNFLPLALMVIGGVGADQLKRKYIVEG